MINKVAEQVKEAEVRGVMAAFVDAGLVKVASENAFDDLCGIVAQNIGMDYDLQKIANVTEAVLNGGMQKSASQQKTAHETARNAALGELLLMKTAGQIDDATFTREAQGLMKMASPKTDAILGGLRAVGGAVKRAPGAFMDALKAKGVRSGLEARRNIKSLPGENPALLRRANKEVAKGVGQTALAYGSGLAGLGGAGYLSKSLYDSYAG